MFNGFERTSMMRALLIVGVLAFGLVGAMRADAAPITYSFSSDASFVHDGYVEQITGQFTFDLATGQETNLQFTVSGPDFVSDTYTATSDGYTGNTNTISANGTMNDALGMYFAGPLDGTSDAITLVVFENTAFGAAYDYTQQVTGQVNPAAVPEPASLTMLGMGVAGIAAVRRRRVV